MRRAVVLAIAVLALLVAVRFATQARDENRLDDATASIARGDGRQALVDVGPLGSDADVLRVRALAELAQGDVGPAASDLRAAVAEAPGRWELRRDLAVVLLRSGRATEARRAMSAALALNPRLPLPPGFARRSG